MELKAKDMTYDQALYIAKEIVKWQKFIGILKVETSCEIIKILLNQIDTLNKGLDELIKKYEEYANNIHSNMCLTNNMTEEFIETYDKDIAKVWQKHECYKQIIQDLKALKGE